MALTALEGQRKARAGLAVELRLHQDDVQERGPATRGMRRQGLTGLALNNRSVPGGYPPEQRRAENPVKATFHLPEPA